MNLHGRPKKIIGMQDMLLNTISGLEARNLRFARAIAENPKQAGNLAKQESGCRRSRGIASRRRAGRLQPTTAAMS